MLVHLTRLIFTMHEAVLVRTLSNNKNTKNIWRVWLAIFAGEERIYGEFDRPSFDGEERINRKFDQPSFAGEEKYMENLIGHRLVETREFMEG